MVLDDGVMPTMASPTGFEPAVRLAHLWMPDFGLDYAHLALTTEMTPI